MPFLVITKRPDCDCAEGLNLVGVGCPVHGETAPDPPLPPVVSRVAVATLEEARTEVFDVLTATEERAEHLGGSAERLARGVEPGESIPLYDGTVIEVESAPWHRLHAEAMVTGAVTTNDEILAAYNAKHGSQP